MDKKPEAQKPVETVPFFARKVADRVLVVQTNLKAGAKENEAKRG
jgi:hypothetical protein